MDSTVKSLLWRATIVTAIVVVIVAALYAEENNRGARAWQKVRTEMAAQGTSPAWDDYVPPRVPDELNFYEAPLMTAWLVSSTNGLTNSLAKLLENPQNTLALTNPVVATTYLAWSDAFAPQFDRLRQALKRPRARINSHYAIPFDPPVPNLAAYRLISQVLAQRAHGHLLLGNAGLALDELTLLHDLNRTLVPDDRYALMGPAVVHAAIDSLYAGVVADGLHSHRWRETDLILLQQQMNGTQLLPPLARAANTECAWDCAVFDHLSEMPAASPGSAPSDSDPKWALMPHGWIDLNKALTATLTEQMLRCVNLSNQSVSPGIANEAGHALFKMKRRPSPFNFLAVAFVENIPAATETVARCQTRLDQAQIACALERYWLRHQQYPATLAALTPDFIGSIPHDIITGQSMIYLPKESGDFLLYSIGWNQVDDGGVTSVKIDGSEDRGRGDWVWPNPQP